MHVEARLDADGRLHVLERQVMRFTGDWNGGERSFASRFGQTVTLTALRRIDPATGGGVLLTEGDLARVDEYKWVDSHTLRWRSRLPEDPPFAGEERTYDLTLVYDNVLQRRGDQWVLDHDFAFADRNEPIDTLTVSLSLDPVWRFAREGTSTWQALGVPPGQGYVLTVPLVRADGQVPAGVYLGAPEPVRWALIALLWGGVVFFGVGWARQERKSTRWSPEPLPPVTPDWLQQHVFSMAPEVAGAAWDNSTAAPEVAAVLARLVAAGSLSSVVREEKVWVFKRQVLELSMPKGRGVFSGYDKALMDALFESGKTTTTTDEVRQRYARTGFDPAKLISNGVATVLKRMAPDVDGGRGSWWQVPLTLWGIAITCVAAGIIQRSFDAALMGVSLFFLVFGLTAGSGAAYAMQRAVFHLGLSVVPMLVVIIAPAAVYTWHLAAPLSPFGTLTQLGLVVAWWAVVYGMFRVAAPVQSPKRIAMRRRLAHAREWFKAELAKPQPSLQDAWFPWMIGFGLGPAVDKWFRAFGGATASGSVSRVASSGVGSSSSSSSSSGSGWTGFGGGGGFAGGGSSASFAAAVGGMAASVAAPSSSSSSGGGGGGGSSGGGGGGGW